MLEQPDASRLQLTAYMLTFLHAYMLTYLHVYVLACLHACIHASRQGFMLTAKEHSSYAENFRLQLSANEYSSDPSTE